MNKNIKLKFKPATCILMIILFVVPMIAVFIYQLVNNVFSLYNIIPIVIVGIACFSFFSGLFNKNVNSELKNSNDKSLSQENISENNVSLENNSVTTEKIKENNDNYDNILLNKEKMPVVHIVVRIVLIAVFVGLSFLFFHLNIKNQANLIKVEANIVSQDIDVFLNEYYDFDYDEYVREEYDINHMKVTYTFNDEIRTQVLELKGVDRINSKKINLLLNSSGEYVKCYDQVAIFYYIAISCIAFAILTLLSFIFIKDAGFYVMLGLSALGLVIALFVGRYCLSAILLNKIINIPLVIFLLGFSGLITQIITKDKLVNS